MVDSQKMITAQECDLLRCHDCGLLVDDHQHDAPCPRCHGSLHTRKNGGLELTMMLVITGLIFYIPANLFPIMSVSKLGREETHTIAGGIIALIHAEMIPIAILVFVASILVPLLKLIGLITILVIVHFQLPADARYWTKVYRVIAFVGRWSMLDIFMIAILVSLVDMGEIARVIAGPAATSFALVVVITMLAANAFDPRRIWDARAQRQSNLQKGQV